MAQRLTKEQAVCLTVLTGRLLIEPKLFRQALEEKLGRTILPAEWSSKAFQMTLQDLYESDLLNLVYIEEGKENEQVHSTQALPEMPVER